jgi:hypothetical protein
MEIFAPGKAKLLIDVPAGGVFGIFDGGKYVRFLRTASVTTERDHVAVISLGPLCDDEQPGRVPGPTSYLWQADTDVIFEEHTSIAPKRETAFDPAAGGHISLGAIALTKTGQICIYCRSTPRAGRAWVDLSNGELVRNEDMAALYEHYVLLAPHPVQKELEILFDSSTQPSAVSAVA